MNNKVAFSVIFSVVILGIVMAANTALAAAPLTNNTSSTSTEAQALLDSGLWRYLNTSQSHCDWEGIVCNGASSITVIRLGGYYDCAGGELGSLNFSSLPNLDSLIVRHCGLYGSIPHQIGLLSKLTYLDLSGNALTGNLPLSLENLTQLTSLDVSYNHYLNGSIPSKIGYHLKNLVHLNLRGNSFTGPIPSSLGLLATSLTTIDLYGNELAGLIPWELGNLSNLFILDLSRNKLRGPIPSSLGCLTNLTYLKLDDNQLNGSIPVALKKLSNLESMSLSNNTLFGQIPPTIANLSALVYLNLSANFLSGHIPVELGQCASLHVLDLSCNSLTGNIPIELSHTALFYINLAKNNLSGAIPAFFCSKLDLYISSKGLMCPSANANRVFPALLIVLATTLSITILIIGNVFFCRRTSMLINIVCILGHVRIRQTSPHSIEKESNSKAGDLFSIWENILLTSSPH